MDDTAWQRKSLIDLLCEIREDDDRVQEKRFPQVVAQDNILTAPLEMLLGELDQTDSSYKLTTSVVKICSSLHWTIVRFERGDRRENCRARIFVGAVLLV